MVAPIYLEPTYTTYEMIEPLLRQAQIKVVTVPTDYSGIYVKEVETIMAGAESHIITTILANFLELPLVTIDGGDFADLLNNPAWKNTYIELRKVFIARSMVDLYNNKLSTDGRLASSGEILLKSQLSIVNSFTAFANKVDQAGNLQLKNLFVGLKPCANASHRIASKSNQPKGLPTGADRSYQAINSIPNYRRSW
jgi:hypothetical protein